MVEVVLGMWGEGVSEGCYEGLTFEQTSEGGGMVCGPWEYLGEEQPRHREQEVQRPRGRNMLGLTFPSCLAKLIVNQLLMCPSAFAALPPSTFPPLIPTAARMTL